jgi:hypothetical protein
MLSFQMPCLQAANWAQQTFGSAPLGDRRRSERAATLAAAMAVHPGFSIPAMFDSPGDIKAAYTFLDRPEATPDRLQQPHRAGVAQRLQTPGQTFLLLEDTSDMSWAGNRPVAGLGPIGLGHEGLQGFLLHSTLAVAWPGNAPGQVRRPPVEVLGLAGQIYHVRTPRPQGEKRGQSKARLGRARESQLWAAMGQRLGAAPAGVRWERVCDRGADIYEFLVACIGLRHGFIVRAAQDRALATPAGAPHGHVFQAARAAPTLGHFELPLRARPGQAARVARLAVACAPVRMCVPANLSAGLKAHLPRTLAACVVRVFEPSPPSQIKAPLEWILLTDAPVATFEQALEVAVKYSARWLIEEFHKGLKTGLGAERLQLETAARLFAAIAIMSLVALRLIDLREAVRMSPEAPAETAGLSRLALAVLRARLKRPIKTVREVALAIGRLGGHMNRKGDGMPGWQTMLLGLKKLHLLVQGVLLAKSLPQFGE